MTPARNGHDGTGEERTEPGVRGDEPGVHGRVSAYASSPDRTVFTEADNADGWIATDVTVDPER